MEPTQTGSLPMVSFVVILIGFKLSPKLKMFQKLFKNLNSIGTLVRHSIICENEWNGEEQTNDHQNKLKVEFLAYNLRRGS